MKNRLLAVFSVILFELLLINCSGSKHSTSIQESGIYINASDFISNKLDLKVNCKDEKHKIKTHDFWGKPYINVIHEGREYKYDKSEIYGFKECNGDNYRFVHNDEYRILESKAITLYEINVLETNPGGKGAQSAPEYFYSVKPDTEVIPLTIQNIKKSFKDNHVLHDKLDSFFSSDAQLAKYDSFHKTYKINHILDSTIQK